MKELRKSMFGVLLVCIVLLLFTFTVVAQNEAVVLPVPLSELAIGFTHSYGLGDSVSFSLNNRNYNVTITNVSTSFAKVILSFTPNPISLRPTEAAKFELTRDLNYDLSVELDFVKTGKASITIKAINEPIVSVESVTKEPKIKKSASKSANLSKDVSSESILDLNSLDLRLMVIIFIAIIILISVIVFTRHSHSLQVMDKSISVVSAPDVSKEIESIQSELVNIQDIAHKLLVSRVEPKPIEVNSTGSKDVKPKQSTKWAIEKYAELYLTHGYSQQQVTDMFIAKGWDKSTVERVVKQISLKKKS